MTKTVTFGAMHMSVAFGVVYAMTGSVAVGGAVAFVEPLVNTVGYFFHEKAWNRHQQRRQGQECEEAMTGLCA